MTQTELPTLQLWRKAMFKTLLFLVFVFAAAPAVAQNVTCATRPVGDDSNACASTAFVQGNAVTYTVATAFPGVDPTGATDSTDGIQAAIDSDSSNPVFLGPGTYRMDDIVTLNNGQILQCAGRTETIFAVDQATFNMSALGVIRLGTGEPGAQIFDCGFQFVQPNSAVRANMYQYPPAIYAAAAPRFIVDRVRVARGWKCLDATGNSGGAYIGFIECGALSTASITFDGSLDFVHIDRVHCWPFGISGTLPNTMSVYADQTTNCITFGRVDGLGVDYISTYKTNVRFTANAGGTSIPYFIGNLQFDLDGADLIVEAATNTAIDITKTYSTKGSGQIGPAYDIQGGNVTFGVIEMTVDDSTVCAIKASGSAVVQVNAGRLVHTNTASSAACAVDSSALKLYNIRASIPLSNRTAAFFDSTSSGSMALVNIAGRNNGSSYTGNAYSFSTDTQFNRVEGVSFPSWAHNLPFTTSLGYYDLEEYDTVTVAPVFATMGDFSPANLSYTASKLKRSGNFVDLLVQTTFDTNAYTTAAGNFSLVLTTGGIGIPTAAESNDPCMIGALGKITSGAGMWSATLLSTSMLLWANSSTIAPAQLTVANVPASITGISINAKCRYRVR